VLDLLNPLLNGRTTCTYPDVPEADKVSFSPLRTFLAHVLDLGDDPHPCLLAYSPCLRPTMNIVPRRGGRQDCQETQPRRATVHACEWRRGHYGRCISSARRSPGSAWPRPKANNISFLTNEQKRGTMFPLSPSQSPQRSISGPRDISVALYF